MKHMWNMRQRSFILKWFKCSAGAIISMHVHTRVDGYHTCDILKYKDAFTKQ